ncbi:MAG: cytochrome c3 family protein [Candidatus Sumerlaeota bacterium]|nr:cytochrome c3 family protein [Candidatus Sumerlaeota bacterium]
MKRRGFSAVALALGGLALTAVAATPLALVKAAAQDAPAAEATSGLPPLAVDKSNRLTLEDAPTTGGESLASPAALPPADNSRCYVCHGNMKDEPLAQRHERASVGCVDCHGESGAHEEDEDNTTPPDTMFAPEAIAPLCERCHQTHNAPATKVIARWLERCPTKSNPAEVLCTDCHGAHRLAVRTVRWDKKTRQLLAKAPGRGT